MFMGSAEKVDNFPALYRTKLRAAKMVLANCTPSFQPCSREQLGLYQALGGNDPLVKFLIALSTDLITGCPTDDDTSEDDEYDIEQDTRKPEPRKSCQVISNQRFRKYNH